jgi:hypothetical protein
MALKSRGFPFKAPIDPGLHLSIEYVLSQQRGQCLPDHLASALLEELQAGVVDG